MANHYGFGDRIALVTGGASGIGAATVERLRAGGAQVHIFDLVNGHDAREASQLEAAINRLPRLDILVCSAGVAGDSIHTEDVTDAFFLLITVQVVVVLAVTTAVAV